MAVHVLHNPSAARRSRTAARAVLGTLRSTGRDVVDLSGPTPAAASENLHKEIATGAVTRLVVAGGDGLVHLALQQVAGTDIRLTIAPIGTGNDFANAISDHIAAETAGGRHGRGDLLVDLMRVTAADGAETWVGSVAIAGFPADINARANTMSRRWGSSVYVVAASRELPSFQRQTLELLIDEIPVTTDSAMLAIGNTKYFGGGMLPCPDAVPNDGAIHLTSIENVNRRRLLPHLIGRKGGTAERKEVLRGIGERIEVESAGHNFWGDGEPLGTSPLTFEVVPQALRIEQIAPTSL